MSPSEEELDEMARILAERLERILEAIDRPYLTDRGRGARTRLDRVYREESDEQEK